MSRACIVVFILCASVCAAKYATTKTDEGKIRGSRVSGVDEYLGVPFARPPIGNLRFAPPQPLLKRSGIYDATFARNACVQLDPEIPASENCLYLNIYRPFYAKSASVMIWVHGGSLTSGTGATYDGSNLVKGTNTIVVTINYRLGAFGFLALNETLATDGTTGNYGLQDQRAAFLWVRKNIHYFGGNPNKITISGESAGAFSVCTHIAAPKSQNLFRAAIMESIYQNCDAIPLSTAANVGKSFVSAVGCQNVLDVIACIKAVPASVILNVSSSLQSPSPTGFNWKPVIDGFELQKQPFQYIADGSYAKVPVLIGTNLDEAAFIVCGTSSQFITVPLLRGFVNSVFGAFLGSKIEALYNYSSYVEPFRALIDVESDYLFKCPTKQLVNLIDKTVPVHMYSFNYVSAGKCGAAHATEVPYLFPSRSDILGANYNFDAKEEQLSNRMSKYWINFVATLNPNYKTEALTWPQYAEPAEQYLNLNTTLSVGNQFRTGYCDFWLSFVPL